LNSTTSTTDPTSLSVSQYAASNRRGRASASGVPVSENRHDQLGLPDRAHGPHAVPAKPADLLRVRPRTFGNPTYSYIVSGGWARDHPQRHPLILRLAVCRAFSSPRSACRSANLAYYKLNYQNQAFWPVYGDFVLMLARGTWAMVTATAASRSPFFKAFYAGGVGSVRGYEAGTLGPRATSTAIRWAAKRKIIGNAEVNYPLIKGEKAVRIGGFFRCGARSTPTAPSPTSRISGIPRASVVSWNSPIRAAQDQLRLPRSIRFPAEPASSVSNSRWEQSF